MKLAAAIAVTAVLLIIVAALPSAQPQIPSGRDVVTPSAYVSLEPVARGTNFQLAIKSSSAYRSQRNPTPRSAPNTFPSSSAIKPAATKSASRRSLSMSTPRSPSP